MEEQQNNMDQQQPFQQPKKKSKAKTIIIILAIVLAIMIIAVATQGNEKKDTNTVAPITTQSTTEGTSALPAEQKIAAGNEVSTNSLKISGLSVKMC